jgi:hypothetical protein
MVQGDYSLSGPTLPSRLGLDFSGLVRPELVSVALGPYSGTHTGLVATGSKYSVVVPVAMPCDAVKLVVVGLKVCGLGTTMPVEVPNTKNSIK